MSKATMASSSSVSTLNSSTAPGLKRKVKKVLEQRLDAPEINASLKTLSLLCPESLPSKKLLKNVVENRTVDLNLKFLEEAERVLESLSEIEESLSLLPESCRTVVDAVAASRRTAGAVLEAAEHQQRSVSEIDRKRRVASAFLTKYKITEDEATTLKSGEIDDAFFAAFNRVAAVHAACKDLLRRGGVAAIEALREDLTKTEDGSSGARHGRRPDRAADSSDAADASVCGLHGGLGGGGISGASSKSHHPRAALELLDLATSLQENAFERLCRWVQKQCQSACARDPAFGGEDNYAADDFDLGEGGGEGRHGVSSYLWRAVAALQHRPVLFKYCCEEIVASRHSLKFQAFVTALSHGGGPGHARPIALHAHEPVRFVNDMLAWAHQALAAEREFLYNLLDRRIGSEDASFPPCPSATGGEAGFEVGSGVGVGPSTLVSYAGDVSGRAGESSSRSSLQLDAEVRRLLDEIFESICRPLRMRIEQVILSQLPVPLAIQLTQLLSFYLFTMSKILDPAESRLLGVIRSCRDAARATFFEELRLHGVKILQGAVPEISADELTPPLQVSETVHQLLKILEAYETSMSASLSSRGGGGAGASSPSPSLEENESAGALSSPKRRDGTSVDAGGVSSSTGDVDTDEELSRVVSLILDPVMDLCRRMADQILTPNRDLESHRRQLRKLSLTLLPAAATAGASSAAADDASASVARDQKLAAVAADASSALTSTRLIFLVNCYEPLWSGLFQSRPVLAKTPAGLKVHAALQSSLAEISQEEANLLLRTSQLSEVAERLALYRDVASGAALDLDLGGGGAIQRRGAAGKEKEEGGAEAEREEDEEDEAAFAAAIRAVGATPSSDPSLTATRVTAVLRALFVLVSTPNAIQELRQIRAPRIRSKVATQMCSRLIESYAQVVTAFEDPANGYAAAAVTSPTAAAAAGINAEGAAVAAGTTTFRYASVPQIRAVLGVVL